MQVKVEGSNVKVKYSKIDYFYLNCLHTMKLGRYTETLEGVLLLLG